MAKKQKIQTDIHQEHWTETTSLPEDLFPSDTSTNKVKETLAEQIKSFKDKGWDDNRIAARLMISKEIVENA